MKRWEVKKIYACEKANLKVWFCLPQKIMNAIRDFPLVSEEYDWVTMWEMLVQDCIQRETHYHDHLILLI